MVIKIQIDSVLREMIFHLIYEAQKQRAEDKKYKNKNKIKRKVLITITEICTFTIKYIRYIEVIILSHHFVIGFSFLLGLLRLGTYLMSSRPMQHMYINNFT